MRSLTFFTFILSIGALEVGKSLVLAVNRKGRFYVKSSYEHCWGTEGGRLRGKKFGLWGPCPILLSWCGIRPLKRLYN